MNRNDPGETPLFERIPARAKTYDEQVELIHYLSQRLTTSEYRLGEIRKTIQDFDMDDQTMVEAIQEQFRDWDLEGGIDE
jgi:glutamine synthetase type III